MGRRHGRLARRVTGRYFPEGPPTPPQGHTPFSFPSIRATGASVSRVGSHPDVSCTTCRALSRLWHRGLPLRCKGRWSARRSGPRGTERAAPWPPRAVQGTWACQSSETPGDAWSVFLSRSRPVAAWKGSHACRRLCSSPGNARCREGSSRKRGASTRATHVPKSPRPLRDAEAWQRVPHAVFRESDAPREPPAAQPCCLQHTGLPRPPPADGRPGAPRTPRAGGEPAAGPRPLPQGWRRMCLSPQLCLSPAQAPHPLSAGLTLWIVTCSFSEFVPFCAGAVPSRLRCPHVQGPGYARHLCPSCASSCCVCLRCVALIGLVLSS